MTRARATSSIAAVRISTTTARVIQRSSRRPARSTSPGLRGTTRRSRANPPTSTASARRPSQRPAVARISSCSGKSITPAPPLLHPKGVVALGPVTVAGDDAPVHAILPGGQRRQPDLEQGSVVRIDSRVALVNLPAVGVLHANLAE